MYRVQRTLRKWVTRDEDHLKSEINGKSCNQMEEDTMLLSLLMILKSAAFLECRRNGLKNIHWLSWPEHWQKKYLSHVEHYWSHHTTISLEIMVRMEEPRSDSLRNVEDLSIRFSVDGGRFQTNDGVSSIVEALHQHRHNHTHSLMNNTYMFDPEKRQRIAH